MAWVQFGFELIVTLVDRGANETTKTYQMTATDAATAATDAATILAALAAVSAAEQAKYRLAEVFENDAFVIPTSADAEVETVASLTTFIDNAGSKKANFGIPAPNTTNVFVGTTGKNRNIVNTGSAQVIAYHGLFGVGGVATLSDGEVAGVLISGIRTTKRSRQA